MPQTSIGKVNCWRCCNCKARNLLALYKGGQGPECDRHRHCGACKNMYMEAYVSDRRATQVQSIRYPEDDITKALIRQGRQLHLPLLVEGDEYEAIPDSGCSVKIVHAAILKNYKQREPAVVVLKTLRSARYQLCVLGPHTLPDARGVLCSEKSINKDQFLLCMDFIDRFKIFTNNRHRLVGRKRPHHIIPRILSAGSNCISVALILNGIYVPGIHADTGSEVDLIEMQFAKEVGFRIDRLDYSDPDRIELFDGRRIRLVGKILVTVGIRASDLGPTQASEIRVHRTLPGKRDSSDSKTCVKVPDIPQQRTFYISSGLEKLVVVGQELLDSIDAFDRCTLSGRPENCAAPTFKISWLKPSPPLSRAELDRAIEAARQECVAAREAPVERRDRYLRGLAQGVPCSDREHLKQQLQNVEAVIAQLNQAKEQKIADLRRRFDIDQQHQ